MVGEIIALILCLGGVVFGLFLIVVSIKSAIVMSRRSLWAETEGTVVALKAEEKTDTELQPYTETLISYKYQVDRIEYQSAAKFCHYSCRWSSLNGIIGLQPASPSERYQIGKQFKVHYLRTAPDQSVLNPPTTLFRHVLFTIFGTGLVAVCGNLIKLAIKDLGV